MQNSLNMIGAALERHFIAQMLTSAGVGKPSGSFGGGAGEAQFASFLTEHYADAVMSKGGLGLTESIVTSMLAARDHEEN